MSHWKMCHVTFGVKYQATIVASAAHTKAFVVCSWNLLLAFKTESEIGESLFTSVIQVFSLQTWPFYKMSVWWLFAQCCSLYLCEYLHRIIILMSHLSGVTQQWFGVCTLLCRSCSSQRYSLTLTKYSSATHLQWNLKNCDDCNL